MSRIVVDMAGVGQDVETRHAEAPTPPLTFEVLFHSQRLAMVRLAHLITGSNAEAEEIVQEAFLRLRAHWDRPDNHIAYLRTIVTNLCKTHVRRRDLERTIARPDARVVIQPEIDEMWIAICRLPIRQRAALALRFYEDLSEAEIARILRCRPGTVKSTIHRALARLKEEMA